MAASALGQTYNVYTVAGGSVPDRVRALKTTIGAATALAVGPEGDLYMTLADYSAVVRMDSRGGLHLVAGTGLPGFDGDGGPATQALLNRASGPAFDQQGNLYIADTFNGRIRKVSDGIITTVAGNGATAFFNGAANGNGGPAVNAQLGGPIGITVDAAGTIYFADSYLQQIRKIEQGIITTVAGGGVSESDNVPALQAELVFPVGIAADKTGTVYYSDGSGSSCIRKISGGTVTTVAGSALFGLVGYTGDGGPATQATLAAPGQMVLDTAGNLYFIDTGNSVVRKISNGVITTVAGNGTLGSTGDGGLATRAELALGLTNYSEIGGLPLDEFIAGIALDSDGNLFIGDILNGVVRRVRAGIISRFAGDAGNITQSGDGLSAPYARLNALSVALADNGDIYIGDSYNNCIRKVSQGIITTVAGSGAPGYAGDGGPAENALLNLCTGNACSSSVAVDHAGNLFIGDINNHVIREVSNGIITTFAGNGTKVFSGDGGPAIKAGIPYPNYVTLDSAGALYVSTPPGIRKIANGTITTVAGNLQADMAYPPYSESDGPATDVAVYPYGTAVDGEGDIYFAELLPGHIREVTNGNVVTIAGNPSVAAVPPYGDGGPALNARISPDGVAVDLSGNIFASDGGLIRKITSGIINTIAGLGIGYSSTSAEPVTGPGNNLVLDSEGISVDKGGNVYVPDRSAGILRVLVPVDPACTFSIGSITHTSEAMNVQVGTQPSCSWVVTGLPVWLSGQMVHTGPGEVNLRIAAWAPEDEMVTISVAGNPVEVYAYHLLRR